LPPPLTVAPAPCLAPLCAWGMLGPNAQDEEEVGTSGGEGRKERMGEES
jgi:hypothetical protein